MKCHKLWCTFLILNFLLGIHNDKLAIWNEDDPQPVYQLSYPSHAVPSSVRKKLESGITLSDSWKIILDFIAPTQ